jgi:hypothetical protein
MCDGGKRAMALQSGSSSPGPRRSPLTRLFPTARATIASALPPDEVWRRLLGPNAQEWQIGESRRYTVRPRPNGPILDIDGPYGAKKIGLTTEATVHAVAGGTSLALTSWMTSMPFLLMTVGLLCLTLAPMLLSFSVSVPPLVLLVVLYGSGLIGLKAEAHLIKHYCASCLSEDPRRV